MKPTIIACMHGNEPYGKQVIAKLPKDTPAFIANEKAVEENLRFINQDLNRSFPGKKNGNHEEMVAFNLLKKIKNHDHVIDLHSSSNDCPMFGIITKPTLEKIMFAKKLGLKKLVIMPEVFGSGGALIDHVKCGISIEVGPHERKKNVNEVLELISNMDNQKDIALEIFRVEEVVKKKTGQIKMKNFQNIEKGQIIQGKTKAKKDFTAVLVNEKAYKSILCLAAKKMITI